MKSPRAAHEHRRVAHEGRRYVQQGTILIETAVSLIEKFKDVRVRNEIGEGLAGLYRHISRIICGHCCNDFSLGMTGAAGFGIAASTLSTPETTGKSR